MARWSNPADALVALGNVLAPAAPDAVMVVGIDGVGRGRECCTPCGLLRVEMLRVDPQDGGPHLVGRCGDVVLGVAVTWTTCIPVIKASGAAPDPLVSTNASLGALRNGWTLLRSLWGSDEAAWWRLVGILPAGEGNCEGVRIDLETDISVCGPAIDEQIGIC